MSFRSQCMLRRKFTTDEKKGMGVMGSRARDIRVPRVSSALEVGLRFMHETIVSNSNALKCFLGD